MSRPNADAIRKAAAAGIAGALITAVGGLVVQAVVQPSTSVSDEMWSYPWSSDALVPISIIWALAHALVIVALLGFYRSGMAGRTRAARAGLIVALAGTSMLFVGELASILVRNQRTDDAGATAVGVVFGVAILLSAVGFLVAGWATMRARRWDDWRRFTLVVAGVWSSVLLGLNVTKALPAGIAIYGLCLLGLSVALYTRPSPEPTGVSQPAPAQGS